MLPAFVTMIKHRCACPDEEHSDGTRGRTLRRIVLS